MRQVHGVALLASGDVGDRVGDDGADRRERQPIDQEAGEDGEEDRHSSLAEPANQGRGDRGDEAREQDRGEDDPGEIEAGRDHRQSAEGHEHTAAVLDHHRGGDGTSPGPPGKKEGRRSPLPLNPTQRVA